MSDHHKDVITREDDYFILIHAKLGKKKERSILRSSSKIEVLPGSLLFFCFEKEPDSYGGIAWVLETLEPDNVEIECTFDDIRKLDCRTLALLQPIPVCNERLTVFSDKDWLNEGLDLAEGDAVLVSLKSYPDLQGILRYKGELPGQKGTQFGVELSPVSSRVLVFNLPVKNIFLISI